MLTIKLLRSLVVSTLLATMLFTLRSGSATADFNFGGYLFSCSPTYCAQKDPINVIFDINGDLNNSLNHVSHHLGWTDQGGSILQFIDHATVEDQQAQRASWCLACQRHHQRYNQGRDNGGPSWGTWTMGPAHYEIVTWCGHASTTFDGARNYVVDKFAQGGHNTGWWWLGNNIASQQCDGSWVAGDGYFRWADL